MADQEKIETKLTSARLPMDVVETLERWSEETKQSISACITNCVRVAAEDEKRITSEPEDVIQGEDVIQVARPKGRDGLADAITVLMFESGVGDRGMISALGVARARVYKSGSDYKHRGKPSIYDDEEALAERLEAEDAA